jgi:hypothetical protein
VTSFPGIVHAKTLIPMLGLLGCLADSPTEPPLAVAGQLSVSLSASSAILEPGDTIDIVVRVQNLSSGRLAYSYSACPIAVELLAPSGESAFLDPPGCILRQDVHTLESGELTEVRYRFDGHAWRPSSSEYFRLAPASYQVIASIERRDDLASEPLPLELR